MLQFWVVAADAIQVGKSLRLAHHLPHYHHQPVLVLLLGLFFLLEFYSSIENVVETQFELMSNFLINIFFELIQTRKKALNLIEVCLT